MGEGGVVIADLVYGDSDFEQRVYVFNSSVDEGVTFTNYLTLAADPVKRAATITKNFNINNSGTSPAVIMYLLN